MKFMIKLLYILPFVAIVAYAAGTNETTNTQGAPSNQLVSDIGLAKQIGDIRVELEQLRQSVENLVDSCQVVSLSTVGVEKARELEASGDHDRAGYYWRNAVEHASDGELLPILEEYAEAFFKAKVVDEDSRYAEAATLQHLAELALVRVPPEKMDETFALRDKCATFLSDYISKMDFDDESGTEEAPKSETESIARTVANSASNLLNELKREIANYSGPSINPFETEEGCLSATKEECLILQLTGVAESTISQLWFLDRNGLNEVETERIKAFPERLAFLIDQFNEKHDAPLIAKIERYLKGDAPVHYSHQQAFVFYTNRFEKASSVSKYLRNQNTQIDAQKYLARIMQRASDQKRKQMNEYQLFVAHCCNLAYEGMSLIMSGSFSKDGEILRSWGYSNADDFIDIKIMSYTKNNLTPARIRNAANFPAIYYEDDWEIQNALGKSKDFKEERININDKKKAFIALAVSGFFRIDQSLLTPETSRLFNDVFQKYYEKLEDDDKVKSVQWMVEMPKFKLEDF